MKRERDGWQNLLKGRLHMSTGVLHLRKSPHRLQCMSGECPVVRGRGQGHPGVLFLQSRLLFIIKVGELGVAG